MLQKNYRRDDGLYESVCALDIQEFKKNNSAEILVIYYHTNTHDLPPTYKAPSVYHVRILG